MKRSNSLAWKLCCLGAFTLSLLTFTPLVISTNTTGPMLGGLPHTLWSSILVSLALVALTFIGTLVHPGEQADDQGDA